MSKWIDLAGVTPAPLISRTYCPGAPNKGVPCRTWSP